MGSRSIVSVQLVREALTDPRIGEGVAELLALSFASSAGQTEDKRQCSMCCRPWVSTIAPVGVAVAETTGLFGVLRFSGAAGSIDPTNSPVREMMLLPP
jgi:hypothetical protein